MLRWVPVVMLTGCDLLTGRAETGLPGGSATIDTNGDGAPDPDPHGGPVGDPDDGPGTDGGSGTDDPDPDDEDEGFEWPEGLDARVCADGSADFTDIQAAIDATLPLAAIGVCAGSYGPIEIPSYADVTLIGVEGPEVTTIDGENGTAVYVRTATLDLSGFRLTGTGVELDWTTDLGGAITTQEADLTVRDAIVSDVTGPFALVFDEEYLLMEDVVWEDNDTDYLWFLYQGTSATFVRNTVRRGVHETVISTPDLTGLVVKNSVFSDLTIDTAFTAFSLTGDGDGDLVVTNNVFYEVDDLDPWGGRLFSGVADFRNNLVVGCDSWNLVPFAASYSDFWDNGVDYAPYVSGAGNLFVDPLLAGPGNGDFGLLPGSPAIDAGDPGASYDDADGSRNDVGSTGGPDAR